jgi:hypothetical protein
MAMFQRKLHNAALAGCLEQRTFLRSGDATSAEVMYSGDVANALPIAKQHCASYARVPRLVDTAPGIAYFACDRPQANFPEPR